MNILFLSPENPYPPDHGHHIRTYNTLKLLARKHNIFFVGFAKNNDELKYKQDLEKICKSVDIYLISEGKWKWRLIGSMILNLFSPLPYFAQKYFRKKARRKIKQIISEQQIELVHIDMLPLSMYHKDFRLLPKILVNHNVESLRLYRLMKVKKNIFVKLFLFYQYIKLYYFEKKMCPKFEQCLVVSDYDKEVLERVCKANNFVVIPNGVDIQYFHPNNTEIDENSLIWVGGMSGHHNSNAVDYFLDEILPLIYSKVPDVKVTFVGKYPTQKLIKTAKDNQNIRIMGYVDDVRPYMQQSAIFIAPLRSGSGTKIKVLNAMALEKAVVTTSIGAEGIKVTPDKDIIVADTSQEFAEKTIYLLQHPEEAKIMGEKGRKVIEKYYSWEIIGKKMYQVYDEVYINAIKNSNTYYIKYNG